MKTDWSMTAAALELIRMIDAHADGHVVFCGHDDSTLNEMAIKLNQCLADKRSYTEDKRSAPADNLD